MDTTERLPFHFSLSCIGEGNGNTPSVLAWNPKDGRAWWVAVYGVAQSWTRLKRLSSRSSSKHALNIMFYHQGFPGGASDKEPDYQCRRQQVMWVGSLCQEDPLEEGMATHSSILAWKIPWTEKPGRLLSMGSQRVGRD